MLNLTVLVLIQVVCLLLKEWEYSWLMFVLYEQQRPQSANSTNTVPDNATMGVISVSITYPEGEHLLDRKYKCAKPWCLLYLFSFILKNVILFSQRNTFLYLNEQMLYLDLPNHKINVKCKYNPCKICVKNKIIDFLSLQPVSKCKFKNKTKQFKYIYSYGLE